MKIFVDTQSRSGFSFRLVFSALLLIAFCCIACGGDNGSSLPWASADVTELIADTWTDGAIANASGEQWFRFTAASAAQYIHFKYGSLENIYIQVYTGKGIAVRDAEDMDSGRSPILWTLKSGQKYYVRIWPYYPIGGDYQIAVTASQWQPGETFPPADAPSLTMNTWTAGNLSAGEKQWFQFTAAANEQHILFKYGTLRDVYVRVYDSAGNPAGEAENLFNLEPSMPRTLSQEQLYYVCVWPYSSAKSGTYQITFNNSSLWPGETLPAEYTTLAANVWANGNLTPGGVQWFRFTATEDTRYIHFTPGSIEDVGVQVYTVAGLDAGNRANLYASNLPTHFTERTLVPGQEYYIRVWPYNLTDGGTYQIGLSASGLALIETMNIWSDGNVAIAGGSQWFKFTATASTQFIHVNFGTLDDVWVEVFSADGESVSGRDNMYDAIRFISRALTIGEEYYIRVWAYDRNACGTFRMGFSTTAMPLGEPFPPAAVSLAANTWTNGSLAVGEGNWYRFTATAATQYIHIHPGAMDDVLLQVYSSAGLAVGNSENLWDGDSYTVSQTLVVGQTYYIHLQAYDIYAEGDYAIAFNASVAPPPL